MRTIPPVVSFQEIPNEISLVFYITGCPRRCKGCHSSQLWDPNLGEELTKEYLSDSLKTANGRYSTCVLFMGGDQYKEDFIEVLDWCKELAPGKCIALYTGDTHVSEDVEYRLKYLKTGEWVEELGGLDSPSTNQVLMNLETGEIMNKYFLKDKGHESAY